MPLALTDLRLDGAGDPRVLDLDVAARLGLARSRKIRELIRQNADELRRYGNLIEVEGVAGGLLPGEANLGGRPGRAFLLNHDQAMIVAVLSRAPRAADVRQQLIEVYNAYRATRAAPVQNPAISADMARLEREVSGLRGQQILTAIELERQAEKISTLAGQRRTRLSYDDARDVKRFLACCTERHPGQSLDRLALFVLWEGWKSTGRAGRSFTIERFIRLCTLNGVQCDDAKAGGSVRHLRIKMEFGA